MQLQNTDLQTHLIYKTENISTSISQGGVASGHCKPFKMLFSQVESDCRCPTLFTVSSDEGQRQWWNKYSGPLIFHYR